MKIIEILTEKQLKTSVFWLLVIVASLVAIYLNVMWHSKSFTNFGTTAWLSVGYLIWKKRHRVNLNSSVLSIFLGSLLIGLILLIFFTHPIKEEQIILLQCIPCAWGVGLSLIASGFQGLKEYWKEITIFAFYGFPKIILSFVEISPISTAVAAFILWCLNFQVHFQNIYIYLPPALIKVDRACSGLIGINSVLGISVILVLLFPLKKIYKIIVPFIAVTLAFLFNAGRIALMTILVASNNMKAFEYWHGGEGSIIIGMSPIPIILVLCFLLIRYSEPSDWDNADYVEP